jgi:hypothetical protein
VEKTVLFFKPIIYLNNKPTNIHISKLIDKVYPIKPEKNKNKVVDRKTISLITHKIPQTEKKNNNPADRIFSLATYRENKPFLGQKGQDVIEEIKKDVLELTTCLYFSAYRLLAIEYNHYGCRPRKIQDYLSLFLPSTQDTSWTIKFIPLEPKLGYNDILASDSISKITFDLDIAQSSNTTFDNLFEGKNEKVKDGVLAKILKHSMMIQEEIGGNKSKFELSNGRRKSNQIDFKEIIKVISNLDIENDLFSSLIVEYHSKTSGKKEKTDLKNAGIYKKVVNIEGNSWEIIGDTINLYFFEHNRPGSEINVPQARNLIEESLPKLKY